MASTSSSINQKSFKYDVFLSFRGEDTRKNFVDHLYHALENKGIYTYKDDEKIKQGNMISDELIQAIEDSKFYIIVFSKNYASSSWCLEELVKIMECRKGFGHTAYPVFYDVEPTEVRKQSGSVGDAFAGKWREALKAASDLAGWELKNTFDGHEAKFIKKIVEKISLELRCINSDVDGKLIGMDTRVKDVVSSLETSVDDVRMLGIWGMGGMGKTTLARAVFDHISIQFEGQSFVENVREISKTSLSGLKKLQKQLLSDVLNDNKIIVSSVSDGKNMMKKFLHSRKVLVVLDDVDHIEQLEALAVRNWFKPGSTIIITTRDEHVLCAHGVNSIHGVNLLSNDEAIFMFCWYAFRREIEIEGYKELSRQVVRYAAGLPLTIKILGSFLCGKDEIEWKDAIERLKTIPLEETLKKLELSYNSLEQDYKEIFLDVACILRGWKEEDAIRVLESRGFHAKIGLRVLEQKSLITISKKTSLFNDEYKELGMHDHLEEMGRNIVRRSHPDEPQRHSRLWINEEIEDILTNDLGTQATKCLHLDSDDLSAEIAMKGLAKMKDLRFVFMNLTRSPFLYESNIVEFDKVSEYLPSSLRFMRWWSFPFSSLPNTFQGKYLVGIEMGGNNIVQLWEDGEEKVLHKLRFLKITDSKLRTFDLRLAPNLEQLTIDYCRDFVELHIHADHHSKLEYLYISNSKLTNLHLRNTPNLEKLMLWGCRDLEEINALVVCLKKLVFLDLSGCGRFKFFVFDKRSQPAVAGSLPELHLIAEPTDVCQLYSDYDSPKFWFECYYQEDPASSFGNLERLISIGLCACTNLESFSRSICSLQGIKKLTLEDSITEEALWDLDQLECLEELTFSSKKIRDIPDSIFKLKHLKSLELKSCLLLKKLPEDIGRLVFLEELILTDCKLLQDIPNSICKMKCINKLHLHGCIRVVELPEDIGCLQGLKELNIVGTAITRLPQSIFMLKHLISLELKSCLLLEKLPDDLGRLESLEKLILTNCKLLQDIPDSICTMKCINRLHLRGCIRVVELPEEIGCLEGLKELNIVGTGITRLPQSIFQLRGLCIFVGSMQLLDTSGLLLKRRRTYDDDEIVCYI